jgi:hypothetical protein
MNGVRHFLRNFTAVREHLRSEIGATGGPAASRVGSAIAGDEPFEWTPQVATPGEVGNARGVLRRLLLSGAKSAYHDRVAQEKPDLPPEVAERIRQEEREAIFRERVRKSLQPKRQRLWAIANSNVVLWFLSAVVITLVSFGVGWYLDSRSEKRQRAAATARLTDEINGRLTFLVLGAQQRQRLSTRAGDPSRSVASYVTRYITGSPARQQEGQILSFYPEFGTYSLLGLAQRLISTSSGATTGQAKQLRTALRVLVLGATDVARPTSAHELEAFNGDLAAFEERWFRGL